MPFFLYSAPYFNRNVYRKVPLQFFFSFLPLYGLRSEEKICFLGYFIILCRNFFFSPEFWMIKIITYLLVKVSNFIIYLLLVFSFPLRFVYMGANFWFDFFFQFVLFNRERSLYQISDIISGSDAIAMMPCSKMAQDQHSVHSVA